MQYANHADYISFFADSGNGNVTFMNRLPLSAIFNTGSGVWMHSF